MHAKRICKAVLAALLAFEMGSCAALAAETGRTRTSTLSLEILESVCFYVPDTGNMNVRFGEISIPTAATLIPAVDGDHTLAVCGAAASAGNWEVCAHIGEFAKGVDTFSANLLLYNPTLSPDDGGLAIAMSGTAPEQYVNINASESQVLSVEGTLATNDYSMTTTAENTRLYIHSGFANIKPGEYKATVTWTLKLVP